MRLIVEYGVGDGYTYSCTDTVPVVYESAEQFLVDFEHQLKLADERRDICGGYNFELGGQKWDATDFWEWSEYQLTSIFIPPSIFTIDEYFSELEK